MADTEGAGTKRQRSRRPVRARGGLGQGLGALIPDAEPERAKSEKPLDILFPDLQGSNGNAGALRGGSARDLLSPRRKSAEMSAKKVPADRPSETEENVSRETNAKDTEPNAELRSVPGAAFGNASPDWVIPNLKQPRQIFDATELEQLAESLREVGMLQPVVVRRITEDVLQEEGQAERLQAALTEQPEARYELIMGERRWRAAQLAGLETIPLIIRESTEDDLLREALVENIHRVQLTALEEAAAYAQLMEDFGYTQDELSKKVAKSRSQVANTLRLLNLPGSVQRLLDAGVLTPGHARALLGLSDPAQMQALAERIVQEGLSVRATEEAVKFGRVRGRTSRPQAGPPSAEAQVIAELFAEKLSTTVKVSTGAKKGRLVIEFADKDDLDRIARELGLHWAAD